MLIMVWYQSQKFTVQGDGVLSKSFTVTNGVRQGGILSPFLFNIYMDSLSYMLNMTNVGCSINSVFINHLFYADDSVLIAPSHAALQKLLHQCEIFARDVELTFNNRKTYCMCIKPKWLKHMEVPTVYLNNTPLTYVDCHKYLGVVLSKDLSDNLDLLRQVKSIYSRGNEIIKEFTHCSVDVKLKLFHSYCGNFYGCNLWVNYNRNEYKKVKVAYNTVYRKLMKIKDVKTTTYNMLENGVNAFSVIVRKSLYSLYKRIYNSDNLLVTTVINSVHFYTSQMCKHFQKCCF